MSDEVSTLSLDKVGALALDEFVAAIPRIYRKHDQKRSIWDVWLHANHHAAAIGEEVRKNKPGGRLLDEIADFAMWLFTFVGKLHGSIGERKKGDSRHEESLVSISLSFSDLLWFKYPAMCPLCFWRRSTQSTHSTPAHVNDPDTPVPCDCLLYEVESRDSTQKREHMRALRNYARDHSASKPPSVDEWQSMFKAVYEANLRHLDLPTAAFHLLEEVGEVSDAMVRMYTYVGSIGDEPSWRQIALEEEIADVCSWLFSLVEKVDFIRETAGEHDKWRYGEEFVTRQPIRLSSIIWKRYGSDDMNAFYCRHCTQRSCTCPIILALKQPDIRLVRSAYESAEDAWWKAHHPG